MSGAETFEHAQLPDEGERCQRRIQDLEIGDSGWTVPWAMAADADGRLWLNSGVAIFLYPKGVVRLLVRRTSRGWEVDASACQNDVWHRKPNLKGQARGIAVRCVKW